MDAVHAALLETVAADFLTEAGGVGGERQRELCLGDDLVDEAADHGMLARADEVEVLAFDLVHHGFHLREGHDALDHAPMHHERRDDVGEVLLIDHEIARVGQHGLVQPGDVAQQIIKAHTGDAAGGILVDAVEGLHDIDVVRDLEIGHDGLAEALDLDVMAVVGADGHAGVDHLRDRVHDLLDLGLQLGLLGLQLLQAVSLGRDLLLDFLSLGSLGGVFLGLAHQRADLLGQLVAVCAQVAGLTDGGAVLGVKRDDLIDEGQLGVLELFLDVFLDSVRVFTDKTNV